MDLNFDNYEIQKNYIIYSLINNLTDSINKLYNDSNNELHLLDNNFEKANNCTGKKSIIKLVECKNNKYIIKIMQNVYNNVLIKMYKPIIKTKQITHTKTVEFDEFTNDYLIGYFIDYHLKKHNMKNYVIYYTSSIYDNKGIILMEYCDMGTLKDIMDNNNNNNNSDCLNDVLLQVITTLYVLQTEIGFIHGDLKVDNIFVSHQQTNYNVKNISVKSDVTYKIADYGKSSIVLNNNNMLLKIYNKNKLANIFHAICSDKIIINMIKIHPNGEYYYKFNMIVPIIYVYYRHSNVTILQTYDVYVFMISLCLVPGIFDVIISNEYLKSTFWATLWFPEDLDRAQDIITKHLIDKTDNSMHNIIKILCNLKLKINITNNIMEKLN